MRGLCGVVVGFCMLGCGGTKPAVLPKPVGAADGHRVLAPLSRVTLPSSGGSAPAGLEALSQEIARAKQALLARGELAPYFIAQELWDEDELHIQTGWGAHYNTTRQRSRYLTTDVRVGRYELDSTHPLARKGFDFDFNFGWPESAPLTDGDTTALRQVSWQQIDAAYRKASERFLKVKAQSHVNVEIEDRTGDFSREAPVVFVGTPVPELQADAEEWKARLKRWSARFKGHSDIYDSGVGFQASSTTRWIVNSEGTRVQTGEAHYRVTISAATRAEDGMSLTRYESFDASKPDRLPPESQVIQTIDQVISDVEALRRSPLAEPYVGPALLLGRAAGVFMHETLGHRAEGDRQKDDEEGQTFAKKLGKEVLPTFLSVYDDPTAERLLDTDLNGLYLFDDEGAKARRANIIEEGVFREFLRSRVPVRGVAESNGHGRRSAGRAVEARQGNLIVQPLRSIPIMALRQQLIQEARAQKKAYALLFKDIQGGYTQTSRASTQGFKVMPVLVYRVWTDGRPDELIRGVDIIGTPLTALSSITAAGDDYATFNGYCGSDSGWVPVSAVSPSLLFGRIEVGLREKGRDKPPVLPPPAGTENKP